jgi:hypothetical protein
MFRLLAAAVVVSALLAPPGAAGQALKVVNTVGDFRQFWTAAAGKPFSEQEQLFRAFEARYPDLYQNIVFPRSDPRWQERRMARLREAFPRMAAPGGFARIAAMMDRADAIAAAQAAVFAKSLPGLARGTPVIFIPVSTFNAAVRSADVMTSYGQRALVIGVDYLMDNGDALDVVFAHELFHLYHFDRLEGRPFGSTMATPLWIEGFATYVSERLNPGQPARAIYMDQALAEACTDANASDWAAQYLPLLGRDAGDAALQKDWFRSTGDAPLKRRGYCLGAKVAAKLAAQGETLAAMAAWDETEYEAKIGAALKVMAAH